MGLGEAVGGRYDGERIGRTGAGAGWGGSG